MSPSNKNLLPISFKELGIPIPENDLSELDAVAINKPGYPLNTTYLRLT